MKNKKGFFQRQIHRIENSTLFKPIKLLWQLFVSRMKKSIRFELVVAFGVCVIISIIFFIMSSKLFYNTVTESYMDYSSSYHDIKQRAKALSHELNSRGLSSKDTAAFKDIIEDYYNLQGSHRVMITDTEGNVLFRTSNLSDGKVDIHTIIKNYIETSEYDGYYEAKEVYSFFPLELQDIKAYLITSSMPEATISYKNYISENIFVSFVIAFFSFIISFLIITNSSMKYIQEISKGLKEISRGNLSYRLPIKGEDELGNLANNINYMAQEIETKIENERKAEKTKNELITNVSHDLRTPLTSIMGYIGLARDEKYSDEKELKEYLDIAFNKSERLKVLIDDLFEYTKLTNEGVLLNFQRLNLNEFLEQLIEELRPYYEENDLKLNVLLPEEKIFINADTNKILRLFENLFTNSIKYSHKPGEVNVSLEKFTETVVFTISNRGDRIDKDKLKKIFERFYRADEARNSSVSGSGLGLAITKNIAELHKGRVWADCQEDIITFYVQLPLEK